MVMVLVNKHTLLANYHIDKVGVNIKAGSDVLLVDRFRYLLGKAHSNPQSSISTGRYR